MTPLNDTYNVLVLAGVL